LGKDWFNTPFVGSFVLLSGCFVLAFLLLWFYQSKLKLLAIFVTILVCKQHTLFQTDSARAQFIIQRWSYLDLTVSTILSDFSDRIFSPKLEQM
jgi:hypothetical protein